MLLRNISVTASLPNTHVSKCCISLKSWMKELTASYQADNGLGIYGKTPVIGEFSRINIFYSLTL